MTEAPREVRQTLQATTETAVRIRQVAQASVLAEVQVSAEAARAEGSTEAQTEALVLPEAGDKDNS